MEKMSKSNDSTSTLKDITLDIKIKSLESQVNYWKIRYELLKKYSSK
jgi:hypothetical protein